ncbi:GNAT family N-acetyltransferase [Streptomyces sp. NPDC047453]|uniref:GNAT family N-acetyltransferase n=1 Tax=Streptomyces sp. NPDC047453 TaxID=3154812 RepID=UPI00340B1C37
MASLQVRGRCDCGVLPVVTSGNVAFLAFMGGVPVATVQVDDFADSEFWTATDHPDAALYVHRMAVARSYAGSGVGSQLLERSQRGTTFSTSSRPAHGAGARRRARPASCLRPGWPRPATRSRLRA